MQVRFETCLVGDTKGQAMSEVARLLRELAARFSTQAMVVSQAALRRYRRGRTAKRRSRPGQTYALAAMLVLLIGVFAWSLAYLAP